MLPNNTTNTSFQVSTLPVPSNPPYPSVIPDGRRVGVHPTGAYWGGGNENIDVMSGNMNFTIPLMKLQGRTGWSVPFSLSYNSQNWGVQGGTTSQYGEDIGFGYGWKLMTGSMVPVWVGQVVDHWIFVDSTGAQYSFTNNNGNLWTSSESLYATFDSNQNILHFRDGSSWTFGCVSATSEPDSGVMYPTTITDPNGNNIVIGYNTAAGASWSNSSARMFGILDVRAPNGHNTYDFTYNNDSPKHLVSIVNHIGTGEQYTFSYASGQSLSSPFNGQSYGSVATLSSAAVTSLNITHSFAYNGSGEMTQVTLPYGGYLMWDYDTVTYSTGISYREVQHRRLSKDGTSASETVYPFTHESSVTTPVHQYTVLDDPGGVGEKYWAFGTSGVGMGLVAQYQGRQLPGPVNKTENDFTWSLDSTNNSYISSTVTTLDSGQTYQAQSKTTQTLDNYGNVTQVNQYNYGNLTTPYRTFNYTYFNTSAFLSKYLLNRLSQATTTDGTNNVTLASYNYDGNGNPGWIITPGSTVNISYDAYGNVATMTKNGVTVNVSTTNTTNFAAPSQITVGGMSTNLYWSTFLGLTNDTGPNGDSSSTFYDSYARKTNTTSPFGATTTYTYNHAPYTSSNPATVTATTNGRWTRTTLDGLGRTAKVETGDASSTKSVAETVYASCGCSPLGKMTQQAMPHLPTASAVYTTYNYDGIGRTTSIVAADGQSTTQYVYRGNTVKTVDAAGNWKTFTMDVLGHLTQVEEPNPAGGADYFTYYSYDLWDNLKQVSMPRPSGTQTRTFTYNGKLLMSATNPENGTVSYTYNSNNQMTQKTDAKGQAIVYTYDSIGRVTKVQHYPQGTGNAEDTCQQVNYTYDTNPVNSNYSQYSWGRVTTLQYSGGLPTFSNPCPSTYTEMYSYNQPGAKTNKGLLVTRTLYGNQSSSTAVHLDQ